MLEINPYALKLIAKSYILDYAYNLLKQYLIFLLAEKIFRP